MDLYSVPWWFELQRTHWFRDLSCLLETCPANGDALRGTPWNRGKKSLSFQTSWNIVKLSNSGHLRNIEYLFKTQVLTTFCPCFGFLWHCNSYRSSPWSHQTIEQPPSPSYPLRCRQKKWLLSAQNLQWHQSDQSDTLQFKVSSSICLMLQVKVR